VTDCDDSDCTWAQNCQDTDGDGYPDYEDCDPYNRQVNPGATEIPNNGLDDDCDGLVDGDSSGTGNNGNNGNGGYTATPGTICSDTCQYNYILVSGGANNGTCEDGGDGTDLTTIIIDLIDFPAPCDLGTDCTDCGGPRVDVDGDGHMPARSGLPLGFFPYFDCNDNDPSINASATEIPGNAVDEDCDGVADSATAPATEANCTNQADDDNDGAFDCADSDCANDPACATSSSCPSGQIEDCSGTCYEASFVGDGLCDDGTNFASDFNCAEHNYDAGDCSATTLCAQGEILDCIGTCVDETWVGDTVCDESPPYYDLNCATLNYDGGDCP